jgi:class 3 adenylate cyclase/tetratricopeptide (TPR) repeat protein
VPAVTRQERKTVTVLFCDLVGFTSLAEELDPEDVASVLGPYHARVRSELERFGGTVEKFIGDAVMALFGAPVAHEDDPERAVRAALEIREFAREAGIELRIGIATGTALVSLAARPEHGETMATGDVVNTAARIQAAAPVNGILVSERTHEASKGVIEYREAEPVEAKGKARPVAVWEAASVRAETDVNAETPFVGRESDLHLLEEALARAERERSCQLVTLVGVPGIGKSRLVRELASARDEVVWRRGRCLPYGDGITFWALGEIVKAQAGILESDSPETAEEKLGRAIPDDDWVREALRPLVGLSVERVGDGDGPEESFAAWRHFFEGIAGERTLVILFEDLHWADESLLDFIDHLVDWTTGVPLLVVCTTRPELLERRPGWGGGKTNALTVSLSPLSDEETARLISRLIERAVMPADAQAILLARAGGNPLYTEQFVRMVVERTLAELTVPETVQGIITARLDLLEPGQKEVLQDAAVVGKSFWLGAVAAVSGLGRRDIEAGLHALERKGFVRREREPSVEGDTEYSFLHLLMQEVAYGQIPRARRAEKHRLAAEWIETLGRAEDHAEMLAFHYGEALDLALAAGLDTSSLEARARTALRDAGDRAFALSAYAAASRFYERALDVWPADDQERPRLLYARARAFHHAVDASRTELLEEAQAALLARGDRETAAEAGIVLAWAVREARRPRKSIEIGRAAADLLADAPPSPAKTFVLANLARMLMVVGDRNDEAGVVAREAFAMAEDLGLDELRAHALDTVGFSRVANDDFDGLEDIEASLRLMLEHGSPFELVRVYNNLIFASMTAGRVERAGELLPAYLELDERYSLSVSLPRVLVAIDAFFRGRWDEAERRLADLLDAASADESGLLRSIRARMRLARDDIAGAAVDCETALETPIDVWEPGELEDVLCVAATVALAQGRVADARELAGRILSGGRAPRNDSLTDSVDLALLLDALGQPGGLILEAAEARPLGPWLQTAAAVARGDFVEAADRLARLDSRTLEAAVRLRAAECLVAANLAAEADEQLQKALSFYRKVGATRYVRRCESLLEEVATAAGR